MKIGYAGVITRPDSPEVEEIGRELIAWFNQRAIRAELNRMRPM